MTRKKTLFWGVSWFHQSVSNPRATTRVDRTTHQVAPRRGHDSRTRSLENVPAFVRWCWGAEKYCWRRLTTVSAPVANEEEKKGQQMCYVQLKAYQHTRVRQTCPPSPSLVPHNFRSYQNIAGKFMLEKQGGSQCQGQVFSIQSIIRCSTLKPQRSVPKQKFIKLTGSFLFLFLFLVIFSFWFSFSSAPWRTTRVRKEENMWKEVGWWSERWFRQKTNRFRVTRWRSKYHGWTPKNLVYIYTVYILFFFQTAAQL
jgi:hypothetical protein